MVKEWLQAILTVEWLLGASMAVGGRRLVTWVRDVLGAFRDMRGGSGDREGSADDEALPEGYRPEGERSD